jgi:hypothetical protein
MKYDGVLLQLHRLAQAEKEELQSSRQLGAQCFSFLSWMQEMPQLRIRYGVFYL